MNIGIFAKTFSRPALEATLDAVVAHGIDTVQFNLSCAGLPTLPELLPADKADQIRHALAVRGIRMAAISGTFNLIHPDPNVRDEGLRRLDVLAAACATLETGIITLCTGTRDPDDMWRRHPGNASPDAWQDLLVSMRKAVAIAEAHDVILGIEPEVSNVVDSAARARRLLDELGSPRVKIIMDGANLFHAGELRHMHSVLDEAFALLGPDIMLAHAKDLREDGAAGHVAAGTGLLDYDHYLARLGQAGYTGPLILHSLAEEQVDAAVAFLHAKLAGKGDADERG
jgi:sugar phosphate isomerase/epimerase